MYEEKEHKGNRDKGDNYVHRQMSRFLRAHRDLIYFSGKLFISLDTVVGQRNTSEMGDVPLTTHMSEPPSAIFLAPVKASSHGGFGATRGVMVSVSAFLACHQCYCAGSSLAWGLNLRAVVYGIF